jgi:hypothetical protein
VVILAALLILSILLMLPLKQAKPDS